LRALILSPLRACCRVLQHLDRGEDYLLSYSYLIQFPGVHDLDEDTRGGRSALLLLVGLLMIQTVFNTLLAVQKQRMKPIREHDWGALIDRCRLLDLGEMAQPLH
jgi:hypothetical protein